MKIIEGEINTPKGFKAFGIHCGIKKEKKDMAVLISDKLCTAAGCFTTNLVKAAPVKWDIEKIENEIKAIIINSGNANACTGIQGMNDVKTETEILSKLCGVKPENILVCSTGVIGVPMPMDIVKEGIKNIYSMADYSIQAGKNAAEAIMTTDTVPKRICVQFESEGKKVNVCAMAKGTGMINPNMATMLCFVATDAEIDKKLLKETLNECVKNTFNMISVDGDTSTNDTLIVLANGESGVKIKDKNNDYYEFKNALCFVLEKLAKMCVKDGEGATKLMEVNVINAKTDNDARLIAKSVVSSNLFKAALFGQDANWGRVLCAMGYSKADFDPDNVTIKFKSSKGEILLMDKSNPIIFDEQKAALILKETDIFIDIILEEGTAKATAWGCDLTYDYVKINGDYRS